jgi:hypothetical protein
MKAKGIPVHGIGLQTHTFSGRKSGELRTSILTAAETGLLVHVSELDVAVNGDKDPNAKYTEELIEKQCVLYREASAAMCELPASQQFGITLWGIADPDSWLATRPDWPLLFDASYNRKPTYPAFVNGFNHPDAVIGTLLDNFEDITEVPSRYRDLSLLSIANNPVKDAVNHSSAVMQLSKTSGTAVFSILLNKEGESFPTNGFDRFRFKFYVEDKSKNPITDITKVKLHINGSQTEALTREIDPKLNGGWVTLTFDIPASNAREKLQVRLNVERESTQSNHTDKYYIDDIEFFNSQNNLK